MISPLFGYERNLQFVIPLISYAQVSLEKGEQIFKRSYFQEKSIFSSHSHRVFTGNGLQFGCPAGVAGPIRNISFLKGDGHV